MKADERRTGKKYDRRIKLTDGDREEIRRLYREHGDRVLKGNVGNSYSTRGLAKLFGVSRRLIVFVLHPEREKKLRDQVKKEKRWNKYYTTEKNREYMRTHREYLRQLAFDKKI